MSNEFMQLYRIWALPDSQTPLRISWFGEVSYPNRSIRRQQPSVRIHLSPVTDFGILEKPELLLDPNSTNYGRSSFSRYISVGCLPFLRIGDLWMRQKLRLTPDYQVQAFQNLRIDESTTSIVKAGLPKDGNNFLLPLDEHPWHRYCTQSYCIEVNLQGGRRLIVPCAELIRFYFGSSSSLISKIFSTMLSKKDLFSDYQFDRKTKKLTIKLAAGIRGAAAADIGRICLSPAAWLSATSIGQSLLEASNAKQPAFPKTYFPFNGLTDLTATGKWLSFAGRENSTFVVFHIRSCSHRFPFSSLSYELQHPGEIVGSDDTSSATKLYLATAERKDEEKEIVEQDASNSLAERTYEVNFEYRFPDLARKPVWKHKDSEGTTVDSIFRKKGLASITRASVGKPGSEQPIRPVELDKKPTRDNEFTDFIRKVTGKLSEIGGVTFRIITSGGEGGWTVLVDNKFNDTELYIDSETGQQRLRRIVGFHISFATKGLFLALVEADPAVPFFIDLPQSSEDKFLWIATRQFLLWKTHRIADADPFGFRRMRLLLGATLMPMEHFLKESLRLTKSDLGYGSN